MKIVNQMTHFINKTLFGYLHIDTEIVAVEHELQDKVEILAREVEWWLGEKVSHVSQLKTHLC